jgi:sugar phosphate isomerase/epimerase
MKLLAWVSVNELVPVPQTFFERIIEKFDKKHSIYESTSHRQIFQELKKAGIDGVELLISMHSSEKSIALARKKLKSYDVPVMSIHQPLYYGRRVVISDIETLCKTANSFKSQVVVLHVTTLRQQLLDPEFVNGLNALQKKYNVIFGIENMPKKAFKSDSPTYRGKDFSNLVKNTKLHMTFDTTHLAQAGEDILSFYRKNNKEIINIHLSDYKRNWVNVHLVSQFYSHLSLGEGELPMDEFLNLLREVKYEGLITLEVNAGLKKLCESARFVSKYL